MQKENDKYYYFKEINVATRKIIWTSDPMKAHLFTSSGAAEFYAVKHNIRSVGINQVAEYYKERVDNGTWPGYFSVEQVLEMMEETLRDEGLSKDDYVWELPEGYDKYLDMVNKKRYDRAMRGV